jgi:hypothetical protein
LDTGKADSPLNVLLKRRPDLAEIDLICDNTNISVPYIDLALEILEDAVQPLTLSITDEREINEIKDRLNQGTVSLSLKTKIPAAGFAINSDIKVTKKEGDDNHWVLRQAGLKIKVELKPVTVETGPNPPLLITLYPQTAGTTNELSAVPAFINPIPYTNQLRDDNILHPWSFPFDLWREETRIWLGQLKVDRSGLMSIFAGDSRQATLDSAAEFLGFTQSEVTRLTQNYSEAWRLWGFATETISTPVPDPIGRVVSC